MQIGYIYKITSPSNKVYIGQTIDFNKRFIKYKKLQCKEQPRLYNSLAKYGYENHLIKIIEECNIFSLNIRERFWQDNYNVIGKNGLNCILTKTNEKYAVVSDETKKRMSISKKGIKFSDEHKKALILSRIGIKLSEETKKKIGLAHKGKIISEEQKSNMRANLKKWADENGHPSLGKTPWNKGKDFLKGELNPMFGIKRTDEWKKEHSLKAFEYTKKDEFHHKSKIVLNLESGIFHYTSREASETYNVIYSTLKCRLNGSLKNKTNLKYV